MAKKTTKKLAKKQSKQPLTLHYLLGAVSFWGTAVRSLLFTFVGASVLVLSLSEAGSATAYDNEIVSFLYVLASYFLLDTGYVIAARAYVLRRVAYDQIALLAADTFLALLYIVPRIVDVRVSTKVDPLLYVIFVPIIVISLRMLVGLLFGKRSR